MSALMPIWQFNFSFHNASEWTSSAAFSFRRCYVVVGEPIVDGLPAVDKGEFLASLKGL